MPAPLKTEAEKAAAIEGAAFALRQALTRSNGKWTTRAQFDLLDLCNAVIDMIDDGDCMAEREIMMAELRCDEDGNPVDENLEPIGQRESFGMHHPDSPSFGSN